jgi:hypothetical protein
MTDLSGMRFRPSDDIVVQGVGAETVILHVPSERFVTLDDVGAEMWRVASASPTVTDTINTLLTEFDVERSVLETDFLAFANRLSSLNLAKLEPVAP